MTTEFEDSLDAMDWLLDRFEDDDTVAYAEVGAIDQVKTDFVVTQDGPRERVSFDESGVCFRVFAEGAADYRYTSSLTEESLADAADRAVRAGEFLAQDEPARYDRYTTHRGVHGGWATEGLDTVDLETKVETVENALSTADDVDLDRQWVNYRDAHIEAALATTTESTVRTTLDRASMRLILELADGPTVDRHAGSTRGASFLDDLHETFEAAAADARALSAAGTATPPTGEATVVLGPRAAGQLFHFVSRYFEADVDFMGLSPYAVGDEIGPAWLDIEDTVHAGSWAALGYDAELKPTTPVQLVEDGTVTNLLHNTASAAEEEAYLHGNSVPSLGFEQPPRIHARHLEVAPGKTTRADLRDGADVLVERFDEPWLRDEFERVQRSGSMPASVLYAKHLERKVEERPDKGSSELPIAEGYRLVDGERAGRIGGVSLAYEPTTLHEVTDASAARGTVTGVSEKHKSRLPYAVTTPGIRLRGTLRSD
jgi:TldD protein